MTAPEPEFVPESAEDWFARVVAALGDDGTLPAIGAETTAAWDAFPFVISEGARTRPVVGLTATERARVGEEPAQCHCRGVTRSTDVEAEANLVWQNESWRLTRFPRTGLPVMLMLSPRDHHDLDDLPEALASEMGVLVTRVAAAVEALPSVARCHVSRWGDGGAHLHLWFIARPARHPQVMGSVAILWEDLLPPLPDDVRDANVAHVVQHLMASHGGRPARAAQ